ncbi:MAG: AMP-binding protein, partial [Campylobacter sp.]
YKIVDGRLFLRSDTMFLGYLNHDENINQWFDSGDLVDIDKDGFLQILGRSKELINVAGNKLLACEVETCIMELEQISDVIVYSKPSLITGEMVVCDVVSTLNKDETKALIKSHCKAKLERYKVPVKINLVNKINLTNRFKKDRKLR